jgi:hypothetical protein
VVKGGVKKSLKVPLERERNLSLYYRRRRKITLIKSMAYSFLELRRLRR